MLNFNSIMIGTEDDKRLAAFYEKGFNKPADSADGGYHGWQIGATSFTIGFHSEIHGSAREPARVLLNLEVNALSRTPSHRAAPSQRERETTSARSLPAGEAAVT